MNEKLSRWHPVDEKALADLLARDPNAISRYAVNTLIQPNRTDLENLELAVENYFRTFKRPPAYVLLPAQMAEALGRGIGVVEIRGSKHPSLRAWMIASSQPITDETTGSIFT